LRINYYAIDNARAKKIRQKLRKQIGSFRRQLSQAPMLRSASAYAPQEQLSQHGEPLR